MIRHLLYSRLRSAENLIDRYANIALISLLCLLCVWAWWASAPKLLWFDEQLGLAAAMVPRVGDIPTALALPVDLNPPLHHLFMRLSIGLLGYSPMAARLPSLLAMLVFLLCLFIFVSRRLRPAYGILAVLLVMCVPVTQFAWEARPYALLLGFTGIALVSYQSRIGGKGTVPLAALLACCSGLVLSHYYGLLIIGAFAAGEIVRTLQRKKFDWPLGAGLVAIPCATLLLLGGLIRQQWAAMGPYRNGPRVSTLWDAYGLYAMDARLIWMGAAGVVLLLCLRSSAEEGSGGAEGPGFSGPEIAAAAFLLALPLMGLLVSGVTGVFVPRYFVAAAAGYAILICYLAARVHRRFAGITLVLSLTAAAGMAWSVLHAVNHMNDPPGFSQQLDILEAARAPIVFEDPKAYLACREFAPEFAMRFYYAADPELAFKVTKTGFDDVVMRAMAKLQPVQAMRLDDIARTSDTWILVPAQNYGWLSKCLVRMGNSVEWETPAPGSEPDMRPVTIRLPRPDSMAAPWCEAPPAH